MKQPRVLSFDGLRGVAALVVVLHHALLSYPILRAVHEDGPAVAEAGSLAWWMVHTPLHLFWAGGEAVFVFFVLSGAVLAMQTTKPGFSWRAYYPARAVRLYGPVWGSIVFAILIFLAVRALSPAAGAAWVSERGTDLSPLSILKAGIFLRGTQGFNGPLWSLLWEVIFSVLLPLFILVLVRAQLRWPTRMALVFVAMTIGSLLRSEIPAIGNLLLYMSMFGIGVIFAAEHVTFRAYAERVQRAGNGRTIWTLLMVAGLLALCSYWFIQPAGLPVQVTHLAFPIQLAGAAVIVFCVAFDRHGRRFFESGPALWLGKISFSLYLVHDPIILAVNHLTGGEMQPVVIIVGVPVSLLIAAAFHNLIEGPSNRLSSAVKARLTPGRNAGRQRQDAVADVAG